MLRSVAAVALAAALAGCASSSSEIKAAYVSPLQYQNLNCPQIGQEMERVSRHASEAAGVQDA